MPQFSKLQVYENGGMINFATESGVLLRSEPKGSVRFLPWSVSGFTFEHIGTGANIGYVAAYDDVLDSTGATYGVSQTAVAEALGLFFLADSGGGTDAIYYNKNIFQNMTAIVGFSGSTAVVVANDLIYYGIFIHEKITVIDARITMQSGTGNAAFAMYSATASGAIGDKIFNSAQVAAGANVSNIYTFPSPQVFERGLYYFAVNQSEGCTYYGVTAAQTFAAFGGIANSGALRNAGKASVTYNETLPTTPPALTAQSISVPTLYFNLQP